MYLVTTPSQAGIVLCLLVYLHAKQTNKLLERNRCNLEIRTRVTMSHMSDLGLDLESYFCIC